MATTEPPGADASPAARNARLFDSLADTYDAVGVEFFGPIARGLLDLLDPQPGESFLDVGCGTGALLIPAARAVGRSGRAVGIDVSPAMVSAARTHADRLGLGHVEVAVGDAQFPELPAGAFDVVGSSLVLFFLPDPLRALTAWRHAVAPGGRLGVSTFGPQDDVWRSVDDVFTPYLPPQMLDARASGTRGPFASDEGMAELLTAAGLGDVMTEVSDVAVRFADAAHWEAFSWSTGQRAMWAMVPEGERSAVRAEAGRRLAAAAADDGSIVLTQRVRYTVGSA
jgi:ubiquinone/menaquinone biosynthesis C-methylase UbiE